MVTGIFTKSTFYECSYFYYDENKLIFKNPKIS